MADLTAGWGFPANARKRHFFTQGAAVSLCGRWLFLGLRAPDPGQATRDDCVPCRRALERSGSPEDSSEITHWMRTSDGREFTVHQAANNWLSVNFADGAPGIVSPAEVSCSEAAWKQLLDVAGGSFADQWRWDNGLILAAAGRTGRRRRGCDVTNPSPRAPVSE